jgi:histone H3/H4
MKGKKTHPLSGRIKRIMQQDEEVGKISQATPMLIANAMEQFVKKLCTGTAAIAAERGSKTISASHLKACIHGNELLDFLKEVMKDVQDLPPEENAKPKMPRSALEGEVDADGPPSRGRGRRGRPSGPGRGRLGRPPGSGSGRGSRGGSSARPKAVEDDVNLEEMEGAEVDDDAGSTAAQRQDQECGAATPALGFGGLASPIVVPIVTSRAATALDFAFHAGNAAAVDEDDYDEDEEEEA